MKTTMKTMRKDEKLWKNNENNENIMKNYEKQNENNEKIMKNYEKQNENNEKIMKNYEKQNEHVFPNVFIVFFIVFHHFLIVFIVFP